MSCLLNWRSVGMGLCWRHGQLSQLQICSNIIWACPACWEARMAVALDTCDSAQAGTARPFRARRSRGRHMRSKPRKRANRSLTDREVQCTITKVASADHQGRPALGTKCEELCSILKLPGENIDISAKIGSSPDRPAAPPRREEAVLLLRITTKAHVGDVIEVAGMRLKAVAI